MNNNMVNTENPPNYATIINVNIEELPPSYAASSKSLSPYEQKANHNKPIPTSQSTSQLSSKTTSVINQAKPYIFALQIIICLILFITALIIGKDYDSGTLNIKDLQKYKDLPISTCMGGQNITNIWYSPPFPFNNTPTYTPAEMTFQTFAINSMGNIELVYGKVPTLYDHVIRGTDRCEHDKCKYRLGDLQNIIYKLQGEANFTCVLDSHGNLFSFEDKSSYLNSAYWAYYVALKLYITFGVLAGIAFIIVCKLIIDM